LSEETDVILSEDTENNKLMTLLFYKFLNQIFELVFSFSPGNITFLDPLPWKYLFSKQLSTTTSIGKNWEMLDYYSSNFLKIKKYKFKKLYFNKNIKSHCRFFFYFYYFIKPREKTNYKIIYNKNKKKNNFFTKIGKYLAKNYSPADYIRSQIYW
jgi:hypothetical protein